MNEPLVFDPIAMERVWGGRRLEALAGKKLPPDVPIGELWEVVDRPEAQSIVADGEFRGRSLQDLWKNERERIFGPALANHPSERFPLLVKLLDAAETLSVQVHPPLEKAGELGGEPKTEVWYFWETKPAATIYAGLKNGTSRDAFEQKLCDGGVESTLHEIPVHAGESIFIPSGRIHAIGAGNVIVEIQQNSDTTYRVFDWNRVGLDGKPRALHIAESMASIDFEDFEPQVKNANDPLVANCPFFHVEKIQIEKPTDIRPLEAFALAVSLDHPVLCGERRLSCCQFFLIPVTGQNLEVRPVTLPATLLVTTLPPTK
ncbi:MAG: type I phosphomannose isomerase catalytic subunit [Verrucomicrobiota bacterium]